MATTTNYGWTTPDDTALVKDGAAAIRTLGSSIDTTLKAQIDAQIPDTLLTTTGDVIYASGASTPARLGIGSAGQVLTVSGGIPSWATPSSGVTIYTQRMTAGVNGTSFNSIAYNGSNLWIAAGQSGKLFSSSNGTSWTSRTSGFGTSEILNVAFGNGIFVAVGVSGLMSTSTDGITWTVRTSAFGTAQINHVAYLNGLWVAVGNQISSGFGISTSTDAITWTARTASGSATNGANMVAFANSQYVIVGNGAGGNSAAFSSNGTSWTSFNPTAGTALFYVTYINNYWYVMAGTNIYYFTGTNGAGTSYTVFQDNPVGFNSSSSRSVVTYNNLLWFKSATLLTSYDPSIASVDYASGTARTSIIYETSAASPLFISAAGTVYGGNNGRLYTSF